jgi:MFS family permease
MPAAAIPLSGHHVTPRRLIAFLALVFGIFMAILDIRIVSSSLPEVRAGLSVSPDEIPWFQTSYLIAEVMMIPLSGFLAHALSARVLFAAMGGSRFFCAGLPPPLPPGRFDANRAASAAGAKQPDQ